LSTSSGLHPQKVSGNYTSNLNRRYFMCLIDSQKRRGGFDDDKFFSTHHNGS